MCSSEICPGFCAGEAEAEESSHPSQAPLQPCFYRVRPCRPWLEELLLLLVTRRVQVQEHLTLRMVSRKKKRQAHRCESGLKMAEKAMEGPEDLCSGSQARPASRESSHFEGLYLSLSFFSASFGSSLPCVAPFCCACCAEVNDGKMCRFYCIPYCHLFFFHSTTRDSTMHRKSEVLDGKEVKKDERLVKALQATS